MNELLCHAASIGEPVELQMHNSQLVCMGRFIWMRTPAAERLRLNQVEVGLIWRDERLLWYSNHSGLEKKASVHDPAAAG